MIARMSPAVLAALVLLAGCSGQPADEGAKVRKPRRRPSFELKVESPKLHLLNGQRLQTAVVVTWPADAEVTEVEGAVEVDPAGEGVRARLGPPKPAPEGKKEVNLPLTLLVAETARAGEHVVIVRVTDARDAAAETRITVVVPPKY